MAELELRTTVDLGEEDWRENDHAVSWALRTFSACGKPPDRLLWLQLDHYTQAESRG